MKKLIIAVLAIALTCTAAYAQRETRNVPSFSKLSFGAPGKLYLRQGSTQKVEIEGDRDVLEKIITEVSGNRLVIKSDEKWYNWNWGNDKITVYITMKNIEDIQVSGSGNLIGEGRISTDDLYLKVSGSGNLTIEADAKGDLEADVSGSGNIKMSGRCASVDSDVSGSGNVSLEVAVARSANFGISGSGKITVSGTGDTVKTSISGSGTLRGADFEVNSCEIRIAGSGDVQINVKNELDANISGSGTVAYRGNPSKINSHSSGSGKVRKL